MESCPFLAQAARVANYNLKARHDDDDASVVYNYLLGFQIIGVMI